MIGSKRPPAPTYPPSGLPETPALAVPAPAPLPADDGGLRTFEAWAKELGSDPAMVAAARAGNGWAQGHELSREDFERALADAGDVELGMPETDRKDDE